MAEPLLICPNPACPAAWQGIKSDAVPVVGGGYLCPECGMPLEQGRDTVPDLGEEEP